MELEWERGSAPIVLDLEAAARLLAPAQVEPTELELIREGLANTNYRLTSADGRRLHLRVLQRSPANLAAEVAVMRRVEGLLPVPRILHSDSSQGIILMESLDGSTLQKVMADGDDPVPYAFDCGRALAALQQIQFGQAGFLDAHLNVAQPWGSVWDGLWGFANSAFQGDLARQRCSSDLLDGCANVWLESSDALKEATALACLSHGDFKPSNLLVERGRLSGVLDWEFAHAGTWLLDAGQVLRYLDDRRSEFAVRFQSGFEGAGGVCHLEWRRLAQIIDLANLVDFLNRPKLNANQEAALQQLVTKSVKELG